MFTIEIDGRFTNTPISPSVMSSFCHHLVIHSNPNPNPNLPLGIRVLYTGDYSMEEDRHLMQAEVPPGAPPDVLIVESTFGVITLPPKGLSSYPVKPCQTPYSHQYTPTHPMSHHVTHTIIAI